MEDPQLARTDRTEEILNKYLDFDFKVFPLARQPASIADVNALSERLSVSFPDGFIAHVCGRFPGIYVEVKPEVWPRPKLYDVGPAWSFSYGLHTLTPCPTSEEWMRIDSAAAQFQTDSGHNAVPIMRIIGDADLYCIDASGSIVQYDHETNELKPVSMGFWELFEHEIRELKDRKIQKTAMI